MLDDHLPLFWSSLLPEVLGCLLCALLVSAGHDDPGLEFQQLPSQGLPDAAVRPGHDDRFPSHSVGGITKQLGGFLHREQPAHEEQDPAANNSSYEQRSGHVNRGQITSQRISDVHVAELHRKYLLHNTEVLATQYGSTYYIIRKYLLHNTEVLTMYILPKAYFI